ncbi:MAG: SMP-30/gluconolactonase/LRE family protein [Anaerolineales bacterium]|nr:SMP-30/gluconolactonase/LRE family protein [Anaerolineales bacterium]
MKPELLLDVHAELGEGPCWDARRGVLHWVDIHAGQVHTYDPRNGADRVLAAGEAVGCVVPAWNGDLLLALRSGFARLDLQSGALTRLVVPPNHPPANRFNDGKCDPAGRFLAGTLDDAGQAASGCLYSLDPDGGLQTLVTGVRISNGLTWSPDYRTFYYIDTPTRQVMAYDYDLATGTLANRRPVVTVPPELGWPDGMTSDQEGMLWIAMWGGAALTRWNPRTGQLLDTIPFPAWNVTSCVFGGPDLGDLYVTSACMETDADCLERYPHSGGLFRLRAGVTGMPTYVFGEYSPPAWQH